ncbi:MAG TPA: HAD hydrolase-like protein [Thermoanaerobaculia bacterium]|nr:HAD hydrolase-like protein [Thermoanaerobaculia bacterium]
MNVFFDLDGTLTDPGLGITRCIEHALVSLGRPAPDVESLRRFVGPPLHQSFAEILETRDEAAVAEAVRLYRERFVSLGMFENSVYPDVPSGLETLRRAGHRLWVVTSKPHVYARRIVEHFGLSECFEKVYGAELSGENSEKTQLIREVLVQEAISPEEATMVGDRALDVFGARANGVAALAVLWGYGSEEELRAAAPDSIVLSMPELCEQIERKRKESGFV